MYRGTLTQSADPETKKDVAVKTIKSMHLYTSPVVMEMSLLVPHNSPLNLYFGVEVNYEMHEFWPLKAEVIVEV